MSAGLDKEAVISRSYRQSMTRKAFVVSLVLIAGLIALSATPGIGAIVGLFFGFTIAFFVAPLAFGLQWAIDLAGVSIKLEQLLHLLILFYGCCVVFALYRAYRSFSTGDRDKARLTGAKAALFAALPLAAYLSMDALAKAWR